MKLLEAICFFGLIGTWIAAECIPVCVLLFAVSTVSGIICIKEADKR